MSWMYTFIIHINHNNIYISTYSILQYLCIFYDNIISILILVSIDTS